MRQGIITIVFQCRRIERILMRSVNLGYHGNIMGGPAQGGYLVKKTVRHSRTMDNEGNST